MSAGRENTWWADRNRQQTAERVAQTTGVNQERLKQAAEVARQAAARRK